MTPIVVAFLTIGQPAGQETVAEKAFRLAASPAPGKSLTDFPQVRIDEPSVMPSLPPDLRMEKAWQTGQKCGPVALFYLLRAHGHKVSLDEVLDRVAVTENGCSLADLQEAAVQFGMKTKVIKFVPEELSAVPKPFIIHWLAPGLKGQGANHFDVIVREVNQDLPDGGQCELINTTNCIALRVPTKIMGPRLSGFALVADESRSPWYLGLWSVFSLVMLGNVCLAGAYLYRRARMT
jgi:hypothetical protein